MSQTAHNWPRRLEQFLGGFIAGNDVLSKFDGRMSLVLHGSTTMGIDDAFSDLDIWLLLSAQDLAEFDSISPSRFVEFELDGKKGHLNAIACEDFADRLSRCDMDLIYQLRSGVILSDGAGCAAELQRLARRPMREDVRQALFFYHYTEMRGEHRACDTPMDRVDPPALLLSLTKAIANALQSAMVLDGEPYPYDKWLYRAAACTPTGAAVVAGIDKILELVGSGHLCYAGGEATHPISLELRSIRRVLIDAAKAGGIDQPWLSKWWLYIDPARQAYRMVRWV